MGRRTQLKPQSRIHLKSSSKNIPSFLYGKCCIQSGSVEKYSSRLKPYHFGLAAFAGSAAAARRETENGIAAPAATPAIDFSIVRREIVPAISNELFSCLSIFSPFRLSSSIAAV